MLKLANIRKLYRAAEIETAALSEVSLEVAEREFVAIMGPSGCGKSTLLNILGLLDRADEGSFSFLGEEVALAGEARLTALRREHIGFIFQNFNLIDDLNVYENVEVALLYRGLSGRERKERVMAALEGVGIAHRAKHRPQQLSGGQQQRAAVARALVARPKLLLADEPTGNLDTRNGEAVMEFLKAAPAQGTTVIMVTHSLTHAAEAQRTIRLLDGRIVSETQMAA